jgi:hypothetical protein
VRPTPALFALSFGLLLNVDVSETAAAVDWPNGYVVYENDKKTNNVYRAAQFILPPTRFAAVKRDQIEWLKKRDAVPSIDDKCKLIEARIKVLQELVW